MLCLSLRSVLSSPLRSIPAYEPGSDPTGPALQRIRRYLRSAGRYGPSPFLVGHYGGVGDVAQGFCRAAAVNGAVYILGRKLTSITHAEPPLPNPSEQFRARKYSIKIQDFPDALSCNVIISSASNIPSHLKDDVNYLPSTPESSHSSLSVARCIAIIDQPIRFPSAVATEESVDEPDSTEGATQPPTDQAIDTAVLVFPPSSVPGGSTSMAATVLITGEGAMATPKGKC